MTSKSLFYNLFREDGKRRLWSMALSFLVFFFTFPVRTALTLSERIKNQVDYLYIVSNLKQWLGFQNGWVAVLIILLSLIMGVTSFSYLHSRQKVDFYHGIPVNRKHLFWVNYFNGILIPAAVYGINLVITLGVVAVYGISPAQVWGSAFTGFLLFMIHYAMMYSVTVISMILTGNVLIGILGTMVLQFYFVCLIGILEFCYSSFFYTSYRGGGNIFNSFMDKCSAFALFLVNVEQLQPGTPAGTQAARIFAVLAVTAVVTILSFWLYKKRGSEAAGKAMAFQVSMPVIRIPIVVLASLSGSLFFWSMHSSIGWAVFGLLCGMLLSHGVIEIIYHFEFRKLFSHWKQMVACALLAAVIFCGFRYDLFGYDSYIPAENSIESVAISMQDATYWVSYGSPRQDSLGDYYWEHQDSDDYAFSHMELKDTAPVLALVREAVAKNKELYHGNDYSSEWEDGSISFNFSIKYTRKNGKDIYRSYRLPGKEIRPEIIEIFENQEFKKAIYPILVQTPENTAWVRVSRGEQTNIVSRDRNGTDKAMTEKLLLAYQEDLRSLKVETMQKENPVATIQFLTKMQAEAETKRDEIQSSWKYSDVTSRGYYPIYPSFKNTMELLKECQVDVQSWNGFENVKEININTYQFNSYNYRYEDKGSQYMTITDQEQISEIMSHAIMEEYSSMNPFSSRTGEWISFSAVMESGGNRSEATCAISLERLPESLKKDIEKIKKDV
ncbi:DUF6449 domain-containing protein [Lacrimispora saccharolytica]|uniref:DUF6449 domain-containing protein n=1 Tax=Lacrimispora saccharolytica (strain ATCC 35040 / DSM 2544 / NRCC 2533 / WM1) TaxID=610130 RepID=D9QZ49_LACSW|nr:DUF6449 domain-containing protein [Lacrimispora saccharolytica]ADL04300.1 hypothetical protein Closa_1704 [[Clostridium] saccharolyticum WM1]QRV21426.1 ABC transporter permease [Lacrimispora saccharolytica]